MSLKQTSICVVNQTGSIVQEGVVDSDPEAIASLMTEHQAPPVTIVSRRLLSFERADATATRAAAEFLAGLDDEDPDADRKPPKLISPSDPCSAWTAKANKRVQFGYGLNYLIDIAHAIIVDVEPTPARSSDEVESTKTMLIRTERCFGLKPKRREVSRDVHEYARDVTRRLMRTKAFLKSRNQRKRVEMRFAHLKVHHRFERMRLRGLSGARDEFVLAAIVQNLKTLALRISEPQLAQRRLALA